MNKFLKKIRHYAEYAGFLLLTRLLRLMSIDRSADFCSFIARKICPKLSVTNTARRNLRRYLGTEEGINEDKLIEGLWDNFGRFIGEFSYIHRLSKEEVKSRVEIKGLEHIKAFQDQQKPFMIFS